MHECDFHNWIFHLTFFGSAKQYTVEHFLDALNLHWNISEDFGNKITFEIIIVALHKAKH